MKIRPLIFAMAALGVLLFATPCLAADYYVYCANGKIEVDTRDEAKMKSARGSNVKLLSKFKNKTDADKFAKNLGGIGAMCK